MRRFLNHIEFVTQKAVYYASLILGMYGMKLQQKLIMGLLAFSLFFGSNLLAKDYAKEYQDLYGVKVSNDFATRVIQGMPLSEQNSVPVSGKPTPQVVAIQEPEMETVKTTEYAPLKPVKTAISKPQQPRPMPQAQGNYSIQILVTGSQDKMKRFIKDHQLGEGTWVEKVNQNGKDLYKIMFGHYASRTEANRDINRLPENIQQMKPWVRYVK